MLNTSSIWIFWSEMELRTSRVSLWDPRSTSRKSNDFVWYQVFKSGIVQDWSILYMPISCQWCQLISIEEVIRNESEWIWMNLNESEWIWMNLNESEWIWMNLNDGWRCVYVILSYPAVARQKHHVCLQEVCNSWSRKITCLWHGRKHGPEIGNPELKSSANETERNRKKQKETETRSWRQMFQVFSAPLCEVMWSIEAFFSLRFLPAFCSKGPWAARIFGGPGWSCTAVWLPDFSAAFTCFQSHISMQFNNSIHLSIIFRRQELHPAKVGRMQCLPCLPRFDSELILAPSAPSAPYHAGHVEDLLRVAQWLTRLHMVHHSGRKGGAGVGTILDKMWNRKHIHSVHRPQQDARGLPTGLGSDVFDLSQFESAAGWNRSIHSIHSIHSIASAPRVEAMTSKVDRVETRDSHLWLPPIDRSTQTHPPNPSRRANGHGPKRDIPGAPERCPVATVNPWVSDKFPHESPQGSGDPTKILPPDRSHFLMFC